MSRLKITPITIAIATVIAVVDPTGPISTIINNTTIATIITYGSNSDCNFTVLIIIIIIIITITTNVNIVVVVITIIIIIIIINNIINSIIITSNVCTAIRVFAMSEGHNTGITVINNNVCIAIIGIGGHCTIFIVCIVVRAFGRAVE